MLKCFITASISDNVLIELKNLFEIDYQPWRITGNVYFDVKELAEKLQGVDVFITEADDLKNEELFDLTNLKLLASCRGDPFNINLQKATEKGIPIINSPLRNVDAVAELTVGLMIALARKLHDVDRVLHSKDFKVAEFEDWVKYFNQFQGVEIKGKTIGIVGFGQIGRRVADRLKPFEVKFLIYDPFVSEENIKNYGEKVDLDDLMKNSDFITIHASATEENDNLISEDRIKMMKKTAYLINTAKGSIADYDALKQALEEKIIAGAALDVFPMEPVDEDNEFLGLENVIVSPHIGGDTVEIIVRQSNMLLEDIKLWLNNEVPKHILNPEVFKDKKVEKASKNDKIYTLKKQIWEMRRTLALEGHVVGAAGNVSIRVKENDKEFVLITPSNVRYDELKPEDILIINMEGEVIEGEMNPSSEKKMHLGIYKAREDVNAIIHAHSVYSSILGSLRLSLPPVVEEMVPYLGGEITCAEYGEAGSEELAENVVKDLGEKNAIFLANHGNVCCGSHLDGAYTVLKYLERGAQIYYMAKLIGNPTLLPDEVVDYEKEIFEIFKDSKKI